MWQHFRSVSSLRMVHTCVRYRLFVPPIYTDPEAMCIPCQLLLSFFDRTLSHKVFDFQPIRVNYYSTSDISQLFHMVGLHPSSILRYVKEICLYNKLYLLMANSLSVLKLPLNTIHPSLFLRLDLFSGAIHQLRH